MLIKNYWCWLLEHVIRHQSVTSILELSSQVVFEEEEYPLKPCSFVFQRTVVIEF